MKYRTMPVSIEAIKWLGTISMNLTNLQAVKDIPLQMINYILRHQRALYMSVYELPVYFIW